LLSKIVIYKQFSIVYPNCVSLWKRLGQLAKRKFELTRESKYCLEYHYCLQKLIQLEPSNQDILWEAIRFYDGNKFVKDADKIALELVLRLLKLVRENKSVVKHDFKCEVLEKTVKLLMKPSVNREDHLKFSKELTTEFMKETKESDR
jgi:hypothetical protein